MFGFNTTTSVVSKKHVLSLSIDEPQKTDELSINNIECNFAAPISGTPNLFSLLMRYNDFHYQDDTKDSIGMTKLFPIFPKENDTSFSFSKDTVISRFISDKTTKLEASINKRDEFANFEYIANREISKSFIELEKRTISNNSIIDIPDFYEYFSKNINIIKRNNRRRIEPVNWNKELQWLQNNKWVFEKYKGIWVAIKDTRLVSYNDNYKALVNFCSFHGIQKPLIQYIPYSDSEWNIGYSNYTVS